MTVGIVGVAVDALTKVGLADKVGDGLHVGFDVGGGTVVAFAREFEGVLQD